MATAILINIDVEDLTQAIAFYTQALDLQLVRRLLAGKVAEMRGASSTVYLIAKPAGTAVSPTTAQQRDYRRHWTPVHLDFVVADIQAAVEKAKRAGAQHESEVQTYDWGRIAYMADPFGNGFCLIEFTGRGYDEATD